MVARIGQAFAHLRSNSDYEMRLQSFSLPPQYAKTNSSDVLVHANSKVYTVLPGYYDVRCSPYWYGIAKGTPKLSHMQSLCTVSSLSLVTQSFQLSQHEWLTSACLQMLTLPWS